MIHAHLARPVSQQHCQAVRFWALLSGLMTVSLALVLLVGRGSRISSNAYWGLNTFGGSHAWGIAFFVVAVATLIAVWQAPKILQWTLLAQALPYGGMSAAFLASSLRFEDANLTAAPVYGWIAVMTLCLAEQARRARKAC